MLFQIISGSGSLYIFVHLFPTSYNRNLDVLRIMCHSAPHTLLIFIHLLFCQGSVEYMNMSLGKIIMLSSVCPRAGLFFECVTAGC